MGIILYNILIIMYIYTYYILYLYTIYIYVYIYASYLVVGLVFLGGLHVASLQEGGREEVL